MSKFCLVMWGAEDANVSQTMSVSPRHDPYLHCEEPIRGLISMLGILPSGSGQWNIWSLCVPPGCDCVVPRTSMFRSKFSCITCSGQRVLGICFSNTYSIHESIWICPKKCAQMLFHLVRLCLYLILLILPEEVHDALEDHEKDTTALFPQS